MAETPSPIRVISVGLIALVWKPCPFLFFAYLNSLQPDPEVTDWWAYMVLNIPEGLMAVSPYSAEIMEDEFDRFDWRYRIMLSQRENGGKS